MLRGGRVDQNFSAFRPSPHPPARGVQGERGEGTEEGEEEEGEGERQEKEEAGRWRRRRARMTRRTRRPRLKQSRRTGFPSGVVKMYPV